MKHFINYLLIGIVTALIALIFTTITTAVLIGFTINIILLTQMILRIWIREIRRIVTGKSVYNNITIHKGFHRPFPYFVFSPFLFTRNNSFTLHKSIRFTEKSLFNNEDNEYGVSKIFGFFVGHPHRNSWRWGSYVDHKGSLYLMTYEYKNRERITRCGIEIELNRTYHLSIQHLKDTIVYKIDNKIVHVSSVKLPKYNLGWMLGFYFGGKFKAPKQLEYLTI